MPLTFKQYRSAQSMTKLQPKIKELQRKYKNDKRKLQEETMKLYQEYRVNPFASCLPLLLQMPIFISLYYAIRFTPEIRTSSFWIIPSLGLAYLPLFAIYIISQFVSTELMLQPETEKQQKWLMRGMPIIFIFILFRFPSGLMLYWVTTNLWTIMQQVIIRRTAPKHAPAAARPQAARTLHARALAGAGQVGRDGAGRQDRRRRHARPERRGQGARVRPKGSSPPARAAPRQGLGRKAKHRQGRRPASGAEETGPTAAGGQRRGAAGRQASASTEWSERWTKA